MSSQRGCRALAESRGCGETACADQQLTPGASIRLASTSMAVRLLCLDRPENLRRRHAGGLQALVSGVQALRENHPARACRPGSNETPAIHPGRLALTGPGVLHLGSPRTRAFARLA